MGLNELEWPILGTDRRTPKGSSITNILYAIEQLGDMDFCYDEDGETELCNGKPVTDFMVLDFLVRCEKELEFCPAKNQTYWAITFLCKGKA